MKLIIGTLLLFAGILGFLFWMSLGSVKLMDHNEEDEK